MTTTITTVQTYRAGKRLKVGADWRHVGELVPEAILWGNRIQQVHVSHLKEVHLTVTELGEAIEQFCPDQAETLWEAYGISESARPGPEQEDDDDDDRQQQPPRRTRQRKRADGNDGQPADGGPDGSGGDGGQHGGGDPGLGSGGPVDF